MSQSKIYVGNLPYSATEQELTEQFGKFGQIKQVNLIIDKETGRSKGFAFITFETAESAQSSLALDNTELNGRKLRVNPAKEDGGSRFGGSRGGRSRDDRW
ncbi:MAG: RNA-binding protein [Gammaproteobacteria bacterium]|nr:RNA-binding protein [Gammaproteobacteria bacterium]MCD8542418.1 RNA-binding protein [Gammaproteobacteria bacterium]